jgi:hypothetical protein
MAQLVLVVAVHRDPEGYDKLISSLTEESPTCLSLEMSPYAVRYRRERRRTLAGKAHAIPKTSPWRSVRMTPNAACKEDERNASTLPGFEATVRDNP